MRYPTSREVLGLAEDACGEPVAVRDPGLLRSAVLRPRARMFGVEAHTGLFEKSAALLHALAVNHPLVDGNKRMAWMSAVVFLDLNGADMADVVQDDAYDLVVSVAAGAVGEVETIAAALEGLHRGART